MDGSRTLDLQASLECSRSSVVTQSAPLFDRGGLVLYKALVSDYILMGN